MVKRVLGIDENGLGPLMGPLVVTGTLLKYKKNSTVWFDDISDSKSFFATRTANNFFRVEQTTISVFYLTHKRLPCSPTEILDAYYGGLHCLSGENICTNNIPKKFIWSEPEAVKKRCDSFAEWTVKNNMEVEGVHSAYICPNRFNGFIKTGATKLLVDFLTFCTIVKKVSQKKNLEVQAGKIGGVKFYRTYLRYGLPDYTAAILEEKENISSYLLQDGQTDFRMDFIMDVEKRSFPAALSSIIGKYVRELFMESIRRTLGIKEDISGYYDRKTTKLLDSLNTDRFPSTCLFRLK